MNNSTSIRHITSVAVILVLLTACHTKNSIPPESGGTEIMIALLDSIARNVDPRLNQYVNSKRVKVIRTLPYPDNPSEAIVYEGTLAQELIYSGQTEEAIEILKPLLDSLANSGYEMQQKFEEHILDLIALAYLRLGEQQNCILNHSSDSCLFPIQGQGVHSLTHGSEMAINYYERLLSDWQPDNMEYQWLLNIAYMTLGKHPAEVPDKWVIPAEHLSSNYTVNRFHDVAAKVGLADEMALSGGSITEDFDNNGLIDIMASSWGLTDQIQYYGNNGDGTFTNRTKEAGLTGITGGLNLIHADYNNDGFADVLILRGAWLGEAGQHPNSLLRNNGDGTFTDVTKSSGILSFNPTQTAVWADFNNNGWLDLFIGNESAGRNRNPSELYLNNKDGTFKNVAQQAGLAISGYIKGVTAGDYTNDGYQDLYISILDEPNILMKNNGPNAQDIPLFINMTARAGVKEPESSFPTWFWDYNNDGFLDLFVSGYYASAADVAKEYMNRPVEAEMPRLYRNDGDGSFTDVTSETGLKKVMYTMGSNFGDLDNDGYLDFYVGTGDPDLRALMPNRMFRNIEGESFGEVTASGGFGHLQKGHGVSFADLNNNGHQDIFTVIGGAMEGDVYQNSLFENPGNDNNWITLIFEGDKSNQFGVGNRIRIEIQDSDSIRSVHRTVTTGGSFGSSTLQLEIGLGKAEKINKLEVYWPASNIRKEYSDIQVNRFYLIRESHDQPEPIDRTPFQFNSKSASLHTH